MRGIYGWFGVTSGVLSVFIQSTANATEEGKKLPTASILEANSQKLPLLLRGHNELLMSASPKPEFDYQDFGFWSNQCSVLENAQKYDDALAACERAIALKPKGKNVDLWTSRSNALMKLEKYAEAVVSYNQVLKTSPKNSFALTQRCEALSTLGNQEDAIASCEEALQVNGNWGNVTPAVTWYNRGLALKKLTQNEEAIASFERASLIDTEYSAAFAQSCSTLMDLRRYEEALKSCETAIETDKNWERATPAVAWKNKALALMKLGKLQAAVTAYEKGLELNPNDDAISWYNLGTIQHKFGQYEKALKSYSKAIEINPKYSLALARQADTFNQLHNYQQALASCDRAIAGDGIWSETSPAYVWHQRSSALLGLQKYEEALASAEQALVIKQDYAEAWNNKGVSLWNLEKYQEAQVATKKATDINPKYVQAWFNYGRILSTLKQYQQAVIAYNKALIINIHSKDKLTRASIQANKGAALWHLKEYNNALQATNKALDNNPKSLEALYNKGVILLDLKEYDRALEAYNQAESINPNNPYILTGIGMALAAKGEYQKALQIFEEALNINPNNVVAQKQRENLLKQLKV
ncbi:hypothetical protein NUACC21_64980 [Scytonema sp. NUACC21]